MPTCNGRRDGETIFGDQACMALDTMCGLGRSDALCGCEFEDILRAGSATTECGAAMVTIKRHDRRPGANRITPFDALVEGPGMFASKAFPVHMRCAAIVDTRWKGKG